MATHEAENEGSSRLASVLVVALCTCFAFLFTLELLLSGQRLLAAGFAVGVLIISVWVRRMPTPQLTSRSDLPWAQMRPWMITLGVLHTLIVGKRVFDTWQSGLPLLALGWTVVGLTAGSLFVRWCRREARKERIGGVGV